MCHQLQAFGSGGRRESSFVRHAFAVAPRELYSCPFELEQVRETLGRALTHSPLNSASGADSCPFELEQVGDAHVRFQ